MNNYVGGGGDDPFSEHMIKIMIVAGGLDWDLLGARPLKDGADTVYKLNVRDNQGNHKQAVLKAPRETTVEQFQEEPSLLQYVSSHTDIPVPEVYSMYLDPIDLPTPYYVMEYVEGSISEYGSTCHMPSELKAKTLLSQVAADAGRHLAMLHECGPLSGIGPVGVYENELSITSYNDSSWTTWLRSTIESDNVPIGKLDSLEQRVREFVIKGIKNISDVELVPIHNDYRPQNLVLDRTAGVKAVLDWGALRSAPSAYELALTEQYLSKWAPLNAEGRTIVCNHLYDSYLRHRSIDRDQIINHRSLYLAITRLSALARLNDLPEKKRPQQLSRHKEFFQQLIPE